ncbi:MAG: alpha/beta fold hydrolase [Bacteroidota bacterium]
MEKNIDFKGLKIHFKDVNADAQKTVLLLHGNSMNSSLMDNFIQWKEMQQYRIIAPDFPGHGLSERSQNPEHDYSVINLMEMVNYLTGELNPGKIVIFGHSLGGHIAINLANDISQLKGISICGTPPLTLPPEIEKAFLPNPSIGLVFKPDLDDEQLQLLANSFTPEGTDINRRVKTSIRDCDPLVRAFIGKSIATELINDETEIIQSLQCPVAVFHGSEEAIVNLKYIESLKIPSLWQNKIHVIMDTMHFPFIENESEFKDKFISFLDDCFA